MLKTAQHVHVYKCLVKIISSLRYLTCQGLSIRGNQNKDDNFLQLLKLCQEDCRLLQKWMARDRSFTNFEIQNELIPLMAHYLLRMILACIKTIIHFVIIVDGTQDCTRQEQESICIRYVDENLEPQEVFVGLLLMTLLVWSSVI